MFLVIALTGVAALSCSSPAVGDRIDVDADDASDHIERDGVHIPDGVEHINGHAHVESVDRRSRLAAACIQAQGNGARKPASHDEMLGIIHK